MVDHWTDQLTCTMRADETFTLRFSSVGPDGTISPPGKSRIRSPAQFVDALSITDELAGHPLERAELEDICLALGELDVQFANRVRQEIESKQY